jgi:hypothetical protein
MLGALVFLEPIFDSFGSGGSDLRWDAYGGGAAVILLCAAADVVAWLLYRGHRWARWILIALSLVAAAGGVVLSYYIVPVVVSLTALTVTVLLLLPTRGVSTSSTSGGDVSEDPAHGRRGVRGRHPTAVEPVETSPPLHSGSDELNQRG